jgi:hypothetical protein
LSSLVRIGAVVALTLSCGLAATVHTAAPASALPPAFTFTSRETGTVVLNSMGWNGSLVDPSDPIKAVDLEIDVAKAARFKQLAKTHAPIARATIHDQPSRADYALTALVVTKYQPEPVTAGQPPRVNVTLSVTTMRKK